jgi:hypothetical protein
MHHAGHAGHAGQLTGADTTGSGGDDDGAAEFTHHKFCAFAAAAGVAITPTPAVTFDVLPAALPAPLPSVPALRLTQFAASHYARGPPALT